MSQLLFLLLLSLPCFSGAVMLKKQPDLDLKVCFNEKWFNNKVFLKNLNAIKPAASCINNTIGQFLVRQSHPNQTMCYFIETGKPWWAWTNSQWVWLEITVSWHNNYLSFQHAKKVMFDCLYLVYFANWFYPSLKLFIYQ